MGLNGITNITGLGHELSVNTQTACGIHNDYVVELGPGLSHTLAGHLDGVAGGNIKLAGHTGVGGVDRYTCPFAHHLELVNSVRTLKVRGHQHRGVALSLEPVGELTGQGGLTGTLQTG